LTRNGRTSNRHSGLRTGKRSYSAGKVAPSR
jgi:hypothetical protein